MLWDATTFNHLHVSVDVRLFRHLDHGYAMTSHSSQGQTVNRVLVNAETAETDLLLNQRMAYSCSIGRPISTQTH
jgi:ATP-dependent exoDNAse (exonuclease V) alpha subunit